MGRLTKPFASSYDELIQRLRNNVKENLSNDERKTAFDHLVRASNAEMAAMNYAESIKMLDLFLLQATIDNRSEAMKLEKSIEQLESRLNKILTQDS